METLDSLYMLSSMINAILAAICATLLFFRAQRLKDGVLFNYLLIGFFLCTLMSDIYYLLTTFLLEYPYVISPGDLSWAGALVFLITAALGFIDTWTPEQRAAAKKYRYPALVAPAICVVFNIVYLSLYPEITANYLLYGIPTTALSYFALWLFLASAQGGIQVSMRSYHLVVLLWLAAQLFHDLFSTFGSDYGYMLHITICAWLVMLATPCIYLAARKGSVQ